MNDFIYVPVGKDEFDEIMKSGDMVNLVGGRDLKGEPRWLKKVPVSEYLKSISPIQEDWKEKFCKTFDEAYTDYELSQLTEYIEENIINKTT